MGNFSLNVYYGGYTCECKDDSAICSCICLLPADECANGDIRLEGGGSDMEGRVELCLNHRWGTVCDSQWTDNHTAVVCRYLGFSDIIGGRLMVPIYIDLLNHIWYSSLL